jgi:signal transduction histidine kinase
MKSLYLRIYLTVVAALLLFALVAGWIAQRNIQVERENFQAAASERAAAWAALIENSLPPATAPHDEQRAALLDWSSRLRLPLALDDAAGHRIATSESYARREMEAGATGRRAMPIALTDGRVLWLRRLGMGEGARMRAAAPRATDDEAGPRPYPRMMLRPPPWFGGGVGLGIMLLVLFLAVAAGAWPVVRRLTRRLETLQRGVERFGAGHLKQRVDDRGRDEVAAVAASFNRAADRIEALVHSHQSLLANASHELRSPLARLKMALAMIEDAAPEQRERLRREISTNIAELDALVEEVLLSSRLGAQPQLDRRDRVELLALAAEEAAHTGAVVQGEAGVTVDGDERLLRRALRNLLENARRYGGDDVCVVINRRAGFADVQVCDRGPGVPADMRERIFEPFFRLPGHAECAGGVGLGLALVKQIAERHGGSVRCEARDGGGSCFSLRLPAP